LLAMNTSYQLQDTRTYQAMQRIISSLMPIKRRIAVILFSNNTPPEYASRWMLPNYSQQNSISIYQVGLPGWSRDWSDFAENTGGYALKTKTDNFPEIEQILQDLNSCYLLGYEPDAKTLESKMRTIETTSGPREIQESKTYALKVRMNPRGMKVRARAAFNNAGLDQKNTSLPSRITSNPAYKVMSSSPFIAGDLKVTAETMPFFSPKQESVIRVTIHVDGKDLEFLPVYTEGHSFAEVNITGQLSLDGRMVNSYRGNASFLAPLEASKQPVEKVFASSFEIPVTAAGLYELRTTISQRRRPHIGNSSILVEVPDFTRSGLVASGIATFKLPEDTKSLSDIQPITRKIRRSDPFGCSLFVYNAQRDADGVSARIESQLRIYRDDKLVQASEVTPVPDQGRDSITKGIEINFDVEPSPELTAGNYLLEILVVDRLTGKKENTAAQSVAIELVE
jgi:hypothetical protein